MPDYIMLTTLTESGAETVKRNPERILEVDKELEAMGVRVLHQWAVLGAYDFVNVVEAEDDIAVARASLELGARGTIRIQTMPAISVQELVAGLGD
ncbi:MAG: GYD domain-containing protein [Anaerosomatales bacterium]|nr:GYD domain-containing protein [Anaerosomatales bacterium]